MTQIWCVCGGGGGGGGDWKGRGKGKRKREEEKKVRAGVAGVARTRAPLLFSPWTIM